MKRKRAKNEYIEWHEKSIRVFSFTYITAGMLEKLAEMIKEKQFLYNKYVMIY